MPSPSFIPCPGRARPPREASRELYMRHSSPGPRDPLLPGATATGAQLLLKSTVLREWLSNQSPCRMTSREYVYIRMCACVCTHTHAHSLSPKRVFEELRLPSGGKLHALGAKAGPELTTLDHGEGLSPPSQVWSDSGSSLGPTRVQSPARALPSLPLIYTLPTFGSLRM